MDYSKGKIYKIYNENGTYYGSTIQSIYERVHQHRECVTNRILGDRETWNYELVEKYPCNSKKELETRERYYIENYPCINKQVPTRTKGEYYKINRETLLEKKKLYAKYHKKEKATYDKERTSIIYQCECGGKYRSNTKQRHYRSKKHLNFRISSA